MQNHIPDGAISQRQLKNPFRVLSQQPAQAATFRYPQHGLVAAAGLSPLL